MSMGTSLLMQGLVTVIGAWINRTKNAREALQESTAALDEETKKLQELKNELAETGEKIEKLQILANNGTISVANQDELNTLRQTNDGVK